MIICWMSDSVMSPVSVFAHCYVVEADGEGGNRVTLGDSDVVDGGWEQESVLLVITLRWSTDYSLKRQNMPFKAVLTMFLPCLIQHCSKTKRYVFIQIQNI